MTPSDVNEDGQLALGILRAVMSDAVDGGGWWDLEEGKRGAWVAFDTSFVSVTLQQAELLRRIATRAGPDQHPTP